MLQIAYHVTALIYSKRGTGKAVSTMYTHLIRLSALGYSATWIPTVVAGSCFNDEKMALSTSIGIGILTNWVLAICWENFGSVSAKILIFLHILFQNNLKQS